MKALYESAKGFVHAAEDDFGITVLEAQAAGCPVIAYRGGGALETVLDGKTGVLFDEQTVESLAEAVENFDRIGSFSTELMSEHAAKFSKTRFLVL